jgi:hypothetical protein
MNSVKDLAAVIGLHGRLRPRVNVTVDDARKAYGQIDYRVTLLAAKWVTSDRVELESKA